MSNKSIFQDYYCYYDKVTIKEKIKMFLKAFLLPAYPWDKICPWIRLGMKFNQKNNLVCQRVCEQIIFNKFNCIISAQSKIGEGVSFPHPIGIVIGYGVKMGKNCTVYQEVTLGQNKKKYPELGDNVVVFAGAKVVGGIKVGNNVIIGTNSVVINDIPSNCIVAGNPAVVIKENFVMEEYRAW